MANDTTTQTPETQEWNPVEAVKTKYPDIGLPDHEIAQNLQDPAKFRSAFPEYTDVTDNDIKGKVGKFVDSHPEYSPAPATRLVTSYKSGAGVVSGDEGKQFLKNIVTHPIDTVTGMASRAWKEQGDTGNLALKELSTPGQRTAGAADLIYSAIPMIGPSLSKSGHQLENKDYSGGIGTTLGVLTQLLAGEGLESMRPEALPVAPTAGGNRPLVMSKLRQAPADPGLAPHPGSTLADPLGRIKVPEGIKPASETGESLGTGSSSFYSKGHAPEDHAVAVKNATALTQAKGALPTIAVPKGIQPAAQTGEALAGSPLKNPLGTIKTPAAMRASESGEALATVPKSRSSELGAIPTPQARPAAETGEALATRKVPDQPITPQTVEASRERLGLDNKVGTEEGAKKDTELFQKAKEELGPNATISEVAKRAQEMKTGYTGPERRATTPETYKGEERRAPLAESPFKVTEGANETIAADKNMPKHPAEEQKIAALEHNAIADVHNSTGGSTFNPKLGNLAGKDMYAVSVRPDLAEIAPGEKVTPEQIKAYIEKPEVAKALAADPDLSVGTWANEGKTYLDLSKTVADKDEAIKIGKENDQKAIFHLKDKSLIEIGGTGEPTGAKEEPSAKAPEKKTFPVGLSESEKRGLTQRIGSKAAEDVSAEGLERMPRLLKVTNQQLADFANANGPDNPKGANVEWTAKDFSRTNRGMSENKKLVFEHIQNNIPHKEFMEQSKDWGTAQKVEGKGPAPKATAATARMSDAELKEKGFTQEDIDAGKHLPPVEGGAAATAALAKEKGIPEAISKHMTPQEIAGVTKTPKSEEKFINTMSKIPDVQEYIDISLAGEGARKWYQRSSNAFDEMQKASPDYFNKADDKDKFIGMLAGSSPRQSVAMNLRETLGAWKSYVDAGRPEVSEVKWKDFVKQAKDAYKEAGSPEGKTFWDFKPTGDQWKTEKLLSESFTPALSKVPNVIKALRGEDMWPDLTKNSNFKVPSFANNLKGWLNSVTNDGWMSLFADLDPRDISKPESYHPMAVATRAAAKELGWEPAEAQAAIWSFTQALTERGETDPNIIRQYSEDFADLMAHDHVTRELLEDLGVNLGQLDDRLKAAGEKPEVSGRTTATTSRSVGKLKERIEETRGKGAIPLSKSAQGEINFREEHPIRSRDTGTEFNPEELGKENEHLDEDKSRDDKYRAKENLDYYHATHADNLPNILKEGLVQKSDRINHDISERDGKPSVYLSSALEQGRGLSQGLNPSASDPVVLKLSIPHDYYNDFDGDPVGDSIHRGEIPAKMIEGYYRPPKGQAPKSYGLSFDPQTIKDWDYTPVKHAPEQVSKNASGESSASQEAINRTASQKRQGIKTYRVDSRNPKIRIPVLGVDAADATAGPYEHIIQVDKDGNETTMDSGRKARPLGAIKGVRG